MERGGGCNFEIDLFCFDRFELESIWQMTKS